MKTLKRPAALIAAAVVALAMVTPTAALATDGDRDHDRKHDRDDRDDDRKGDRDDRDHDRDEDDRKRHKTKHDKDDRDDEAKADRAKHDKAKRDKNDRDDEAKADRAKHDKAKRDKNDRDKNDRDDEAKADRAKHDKAKRDKDGGDEQCRMIASRVDGGQGWFEIGPEGCTGKVGPVSFSTYELPGGTVQPFDEQVLHDHDDANGAWYGPGEYTVSASIAGLCAWQADLYRGESQSYAPHQHFLGGMNVGWDYHEDAGCSDERDEVAADQVADESDDRDGGPWNVKTTLCHATASATNPYVMITVSHKSIVKGKGHGGHADDIIPPFTYQPHRGAESEYYPGLNWDAEGQALYGNDCVATTDGEVGGIGGTDDTNDTTGTDGTTDTTSDVDANGDDVVEDEVLGVVIDADETTADSEGDVEVLGVSGSVEDTDSEADAATAAEADVLADTEVQAAQASDEEGSTGVLAMTGGSLLVLLIAGLASLFAGTGLLRRRS